jgi:hypothetical protein
MIPNKRTFNEAFKSDKPKNGVPSYYNEKSGGGK